MTTNCKIELLDTVQSPPKLILKKRLQYYVIEVTMRYLFTDEINGKSEEKTVYQDVFIYNGDRYSISDIKADRQKTASKGTSWCKPVKASDGFKKPTTSLIALNA